MASLPGAIDHSPGTPPRSTASSVMSPATGQTEPTSSRRWRRSAQPTGRGFDVSRARMASIPSVGMAIRLRNARSFRSAVARGDGARPLPITPRRAGFAAAARARRRARRRPCRLPRRPFRGQSSSPASPSPPSPPRAYSRRHGAAFPGDGLAAVRVPQRDVGVETDPDRALLRVEPIHLGVVGRGQLHELAAA